MEVRAKFPASGHRHSGNMTETKADFINPHVLIRGLLAFTNNEPLTKNQAATLRKIGRAIKNVLKYHGKSAKYSG